MNIKKYSSLLILMLVMVGLAACSSADENQVLPTQIQIDQVVPTDTDVPPEPTEPDPTEDSAPAEPTATPTEFRLPPSWTPAPSATPTLTPTTERPTPTVEIIERELSPACESFGVDWANTQTQFAVGASPKVAWLPVEGATQYRVILTDGFGLAIDDDIYVAETSYVFDATLYTFEADEFYGWEVYPLDIDNIQMCNKTGAELVPFVDRR